MMAKYDMEALTAYATKSARAFWNHATKKCAARGINIGEMPAVVMNARLTSTAGRSFSDLWKIDLSCYLMIRNWDHFHNDIIPHELCHCIADKFHGSKGHDKPWKDTIKFLNVKTSTYHTLKTKHMRGE
jgi:predicted SprT family Zn-dependent metalloprotease